MPITLPLFQPLPLRQRPMSFLARAHPPQMAERYAAGFKKAAGILLEMDSDLDRVNFVIVGLGVNLNMKGRMFPAELRTTGTSLLEKCGERDRQGSLCGKALSEYGDMVQENT